jgi:hypothetical protein
MATGLLGLSIRRGILGGYARGKGSKKGKRFFLKKRSKKLSLLGASRPASKNHEERLGDATSGLLRCARNDERERGRR